MRYFPLLLTLALSAVNLAFASPTPAGGSRLSEEAAEHLTYEDVVAADERSRRPYDDVFYNVLWRGRNPRAPSTSLRQPTPSELRDLQSYHFVRLPETNAMGLISPEQAYKGITANGRLVFEAPHLHGITMNIPDRAHAHNEELIAVKPTTEGERGKLYLYGWSFYGGAGPQEQYRNIAIKLSNGHYLIKDQVPINRIAWTKKFENENDWFNHLVQNGDRDMAERHQVDGEWKKVRLMEPLEGMDVRERYDPAHVPFTE